MRLFLPRIAVTILAVAVMICFIQITVLSQGITTAAIHGFVTDEGGNPLPGANVIAVHVPTGSTYGASTRSDGNYRIPNMRVGGPYTITFSFVGYRTFVAEDVYLNLGETYNQRAELASEAIELQDVVITAIEDRIFNQERTGASTNVSSDRIIFIPTISRDIIDLTRITPQSSGTSFAGRDNRFNNYTIDGSVYNNNFGLGSDQFAGGNPISLDVIEEVQINLAPYDVRQGGFTGASVNAVTKNGTNTYRGTIYQYYRNEKLVGDRIGENKLSIADTYTSVRGISIGGPIYRDKFFFFASVEQEEADNPGDDRLALRPGQTPDGVQITRVPLEQAQYVRDQMREIYDYDTGSFESIPFSDEGLRLNARLDWNINNQHRAMVRFNQYDAFNDVTINGNSIRGFPSADRYTWTNRFGPEAITFRNGHYSVDNIVTSIVGEVNSILSDRVANSFNIGYTWITDPKRSVPGEVTFPMIEVMEPDAGGQLLYYMSLGNELFTVGNLLENDVFNVSNNVTYFTGRHTITAGASFEYMTFANAFNPVWNSWYRYQSYDDFVESVINRNINVRPSHFAIGYTYDQDNPTTLPLDEVNFAQLGLYVQNEFQVNPNFRLTTGLRIDLPFYPIDAPRNPNVEAMNLSIPNPRGGDNISPDVSAFPEINPLWSPRIGFNWDVRGDRTTQLRGGTGIFSGRLPFVWISNQINANGVMRGQRGYYPDSWGVGGNPEWQGFQPDVNFYRPDPATLEAEIPNQVNVTADDFKLPQVWRSNIAVDQKFSNGIIGTAEFIYSVDFNSPLAVNLANRPTGQSVNVGGHSYPLYSQGIEGAQGTPLREVYYLTNINSGTYMAMTLGVEKTFDFGLIARIAYTMSRSRDYGLIGGSQAQSLWPNVVQKDRNKPETGYSRFDQPNKIVAQLTYDTRIISRDHLTRVSLVYFGGEWGRFSYTYSGSFGDGGLRLIYVPTNFEDAQLIDRPDGMTAQQQWTALDAYIEQDAYLKSMRGKVTERNGAKLPWLHRIDFRIAQDISFFGIHKLQVTFDMLNLTNLINSEWGVTQTAAQASLLQYRGADANGNATFTLNNAPGSDAPATESYRKNININNTWSAQVGIRYIFN
jgi:hypothetical protein